jgi:hypothetical protein
LGGVASVQRQLPDAALIHHFFQRGGVGVDGRDIGVYLHRLGERTDFHHEVDTAGLVHFQCDARPTDGTEPRLLDRHFISARLQQRHDEVSELVALCHPPDAGVLIGYDEVGSLNDRIRRIADSACQLGRALGDHSRRADRRE